MSLFDRFTKEEMEAVSMTKIKPKHTPGPWHLHANYPASEGHQIHTQHDSNGRTKHYIVAITTVHKAIDINESQANAQLIAKSPLMYDILDEILTEWHKKPSNYSKQEPLYLEKIRGIVQARHKAEATLAPEPSTD